ncbi:MAG: phage tail tape measure protein, partial [Candidatus Aminicenantes bacterium]|nr:phage tail tape measure protein [Candidatus Aminicenantes bacterium]
MTTGGGFIAGSIIGKMVLDMTGWKQSIATVDKDGKALGSKFDALGQKFQDVGTKMTVVGAAVVASLSAMIIKSAKYGDEMVEIAQKVGINVTVLSSYKLAADKTGMSIDGLARGLKFLSMNMVEASKGTGDGADIFKELGISVTDASGKLRDTDVVLGEVATAFAGMEGGAEKTTLAVKLFGRAGMDMIPFLNLGADGLTRERTEAERLGLVLSGPAAKAQNEFNDQLDALKDATLGASMAIGSALIPAAQAVVKHLIDVAAAVVAWTKENPALTQGIGTIALAAGALLSLLGPLTIAIGAVLKNIVYLRAAASKAIVFTVVLAGAAVLIKAMSDFKYEFDNMNAAMKQAGSSGFERFLESIN